MIFYPQMMSQMGGAGGQVKMLIGLFDSMFISY